jgi:hypothetical protein
VIAAANGLADRIAIINGHSQQVSLPERADVVLCDQIGHFGFEAGLLQFFEDARRRFLKPCRSAPVCSATLGANGAIPSSVEHSRTTFLRVRAKQPKCSWEHTGKSYQTSGEHSKSWWRTFYGRRFKRVFTAFFPPSRPTSAWR